MAGFLGDVFSGESDPLPLVIGFEILAGASEKKAVEDLHKVAVDDEANPGVALDIEVDAVTGDFESRGAEGSVEVFAVAAAVVYGVFGDGVLDRIPAEGGDGGISKSVSGMKPA